MTAIVHSIKSGSKAVYRAPGGDGRRPPALAVQPLVHPLDHGEHLSASSRLPKKIASKASQVWARR